MNPIHIAIEKNTLGSLLALLMELGCDINSEDSENQTPLCRCLTIYKNSRPELINMIKQYGGKNASKGTEAFSSLFHRQRRHIIRANNPQRTKTGSSTHITHVLKWVMCVLDPFPRKNIIYNDSRLILSIAMPR